MRRLVHEPLLHFLLLGAALFVAFGLRGDGSGGERDTIVISAGRIESLSAAFARTWRRPPSAEELAALIQEHVREEVFYREALALGLDRDDTVVRRRLRQKLEFLAEGIAAPSEPGEAELAAHLRAHAERFQVEGRVSFRQLRWDGEPTETAGDGAASLVPERLVDVPWSEVERQFGPAFAARLRRLPIGRWQGPVASGVGTHRVLVSDRSEGRPAELAEVKSAVRSDWLRAQRSDAGEAFYRELLERYAVHVEPEAGEAINPAARGVAAAR
jgi:hypothetical protein